MKRKWILIAGIGITAIGVIIASVWGVKSKDIDIKVVVEKEAIEELTTEDKLDDFDMLYNTLKESFPYFKINEEKYSYNWLDKKKDYEKRIKETNSNDEYFKVLKEIVTEVQNKDTEVVTSKEYNNLKEEYDEDKNYFNMILNNEGIISRYKTFKEEEEQRFVLPFKVRYIDGKYYLTEDFDKDIKKGFELDTINYLSLNQYEEEYIKIGSLSYDNKNKKPYINEEYIECAEGDKFKISFIDKEKNNYERVVEKKLYHEDKAKEDVENIKVERINNGKGIIIKINSFEEGYVDKDKEILFKLYKDIKETETIIFDVRGNTGDSNSYWINNIVEPLISEEVSYTNTFLFKGEYIDNFTKDLNMDLISKDKLDLKNIKDKEEIEDMTKGLLLKKEIKPKDSINYKGKIYILVDKEVGNEAEEFLAFAKGSNFATLVGDITEGNGVGFDEALIPLPKSGLLVKFPMNMRINPDGNINEKIHIQPTMYIEETYEDFMDGKDYIMERIH